MSKTVLLCEGDERTPGCHEVIALLDRGQTIKAGGGEILSYDRLGRARLSCRCGAITVTRAQSVPSR